MTSAEARNADATVEEFGSELNACVKSARDAGLSWASIAEILFCATLNADVSAFSEARGRDKSEPATALPALTSAETPQPGPPHEVDASPSGRI